MLISTVGIIASNRQIGGGGGGITATFQQSAIDTTDASSYSFTSQPIGTASATRRVVVAFSWASASAVTLSSATIGGVSASVDVDSGAITGNRRIVQASAVVPTGTTATVAVTLSGTATRCGLGLWTLSGGSATGQTDVTINVDSGNLTVTTAVDDVVICGGYVSAGSGSMSTTWTTATERYDQQIENTFNSHTGADVVATGTSTVVGFSTDVATTQRGFVAAAYA